MIGTLIKSVDPFWRTIYGGCLDQIANSTLKWNATLGGLAMSNVLLKNRARLADLIYLLGEFTEEDLLDEFKEEKNGIIAIDGFQTITNYLKDLTRIGVLQYENGMYSVAREAMR